MLSLLRRGLLAGAVGGLLAGAFGFLLAEPVMDRAVRLESARRSAAGDTTVEVFSRHTQHLGFVVATTAVGMALGVLFAVGYRLLNPAGTDAWARSLRLGGAGFFALVLVPYLRYPSNPPGVGDPATIDTRAHLWLLSLVIGLVGASLAGLVARGMAERGVAPPYRQLAVGGLLVGTVALAFVLPADTDPVEVPVHLIWDFRLLSLATLLVLWGGLAVTFGLLSDRQA